MKPSTYTWITFTVILIGGGCSKSDEESGSSTSSQESSTQPVTLESLSLDLTGWNLSHKEDKWTIWHDADGDILSLMLYSAPEASTEPVDLPDLRLGDQTLRDWKRQKITDAGDSRLVQSDVISLQGINCERSITKSRQQPGGFTFTGLCIIPRRDFKFWVMIVCEEQGTTGIRETTVMKEYVMDSIEIVLPSEGEAGQVKGWFKDPYDSQYDDGALYTLADQEKYDAEFPMHPLSRTRRKLAHILSSLEFSREILEADEYLGPDE